MKLWHRHRPAHLQTRVETEKGLDGAGYDAQADLGLGSGERWVEGGDVAFGEGISVNQLSEPAYDISRDIASDS